MSLSSFDVVLVRLMIEVVLTICVSEFSTNDTSHGAPDNCSLD